MLISNTFGKTLLSQQFPLLALNIWPIHTVHQGADCAFNTSDNSHLAGFDSIVLEHLGDGKRLVKGQSGWSFFTQSQQNSTNFFFY